MAEADGQVDRRAQEVALLGFGGASWRSGGRTRRKRIKMDQRGVDPGGRDTECSPQLSASVAARRSGREVEERRGCGRVGVIKKEVGFLLCEPGARRLIQRQCSVQGRLRASWV